MTSRDDKKDNPRDRLNNDRPQNVRPRGDRAHDDPAHINHREDELLQKLLVTFRLEASEQYSGALDRADRIGTRLMARAISDRGKDISRSAQFERSGPGRERGRD